MIYIDQKITSWERFAIEEEHLPKLEEFLKENPQANSLHIYDWALDNNIDPYPSEMLDGTGELLTVEDNRDQPTLEVLIEDKTIHHN